MTEKKKLTLSIDGRVIQDFKKLQINISQIVETALTLIAVHNEQDVVHPEELNKAWISTLHEINKIITKWRIELTLGEIEADEHERGGMFFAAYTLKAGNIYYQELGSEQVHICTIDSRELPFENFFEIEVLLKKLSEALIKRSNENREMIEKLELLKNILKLSSLSK